MMILFTRRHSLTSFILVVAIFVFASGHRNLPSTIEESCLDAEGGAKDHVVDVKSSESAKGKTKLDDKNMRILDNGENWGAKNGGKRNWNTNSLRAWGKKSNDEEEKRAWSTAALKAWGKRDEEVYEEKRKWGDNKMRVWGKRLSDLGDHQDRSWNKVGLRAWGKKAWETTEVDELEDNETKRTWNNRVRAWGKRSDEDGSGDEKLSLMTTESKMVNNSTEVIKKAIESRMKRSWNSDVNAFRNRLHYYPPEGPKRSWRTNVIRVWGKRTAL